MLVDVLGNDEPFKSRNLYALCCFATGKRVGTFLIFGVIDASFSFDGVIGAFAITADPIIILLRLGVIGAMFVRSLTLYLVQMELWMICLS
ncbi:hypothetical protein ICE98_00552 [Lactococcus lactis]|nr:hypothetical protein [Lactococcus lactis]